MLDSKITLLTVIDPPLVTRNTLVGIVPITNRIVWLPAPAGVLSRVRLRLPLVFAKTTFATLLTVVPFRKMSPFVPDEFPIRRLPPVPVVK